jgi:Flp pilus assembly protein TadG
MIPICKLRRPQWLRAGAAKRFARRRSEEGSTLVEFAVTLPIFLTVLTGAASFSLALYGMQQLSNATSAAVQSVADGRALTSDPCAAAVSSITSTLPTWSATKFTYTLTITDSTETAHKYGPTTGSSFSCTAGETYQSENFPVTLQVSYAYSWLPILAFSPSSALSATEGTMSF